MYNRQKQKLSEEHDDARQWPSKLLLTAFAIVSLVFAGSLCSASDLETITPPPKGMKWGMTLKEAIAIIPVKFTKGETEPYTYTRYYSSTDTETRKTLNRMINTGVDGLEIYRVELFAAVDSHVVLAVRFDFLEHSYDGKSILEEEVLKKKYGAHHSWCKYEGHVWEAKDGSKMNCGSGDYDGEVTSVLDPTRKTDAAVSLGYAGPIWIEVVEHGKRLREAAEKEKARESDF